MFLLVLVALFGARAEAAPDRTRVYPAGTACAFPLQIDVTGGPQVIKTFTDRNGFMRFLSAGTGSDLAFTNLDTGATYSVDLATFQFTRLSRTGDTTDICAALS